jgi:hypothetical protein
MFDSILITFLVVYSKPCSWNVIILQRNVVSEIPELHVAVLACVLLIITSLMAYSVAAESTHFLILCKLLCGSRLGMKCILNAGSIDVCSVTQHDMIKQQEGGEGAGERGERKRERKNEWQHTCNGYLG